MFRSLSSWFGLSSRRRVAGSPRETDSPGDTLHPDQCSEAVAESQRRGAMPARTRSSFIRLRASAVSLPGTTGRLESARIPAAAPGCGPPMIGRWGGKRTVSQDWSVLTGPERLVRIWARPKPHLVVRPCA